MNVVVVSFMSSHLLSCSSCNRCGATPHRATSTSIWPTASAVPSATPRSRTSCIASGDAKRAGVRGAGAGLDRLERVHVRGDGPVAHRRVAPVGCVAVLEREPVRFVDLDDPPPAVRPRPVGRRHHVTALPAGTQLVVQERRRVRRRPVDLLELSGIGVDLPDAFDRGGELGDDGERESVEVPGDADHGHGQPRPSRRLRSPATRSSMRAT